MPADPIGLEEIWQLERGLWFGGFDVYERNLTREALMVFPAPAAVLDRSAAIAAIREAPRWSRVEFSQQRGDMPIGDVTVLTYAVAADRGTAVPRYAARCASTDVRIRNAWMLVLHQQCPLGRQLPTAS